MKVRSGFVSNSSSSSFCVLGIDDKKVCKALAKKLKLEEVGEGGDWDALYDQIQSVQSGSRYYGSFTPTGDEELEVFQYAGKVELIGFPLGDEEGVATLPDNIGALKTKAARKISKLAGKTVTKNKIKLHFGEWSNQ